MATVQPAELWRLQLEGAGNPEAANEQYQTVLQLLLDLFN